MEKDDIPPASIWEVGENVLVITKEFIYDAKILSARPPRYYVTLIGWPDKFNRWLSEASILKKTEENIILQQEKRRVNANKKNVRRAMALCGFSSPIDDVEEPDIDDVEEPDKLETISFAEIHDAILLEEEEAKCALKEGWGDEKICTFESGYITQPVYACKECSESQQFGFCYGCSMKCHLGHTIFELFSKRHFRCDCGTPLSGMTCSFLEKKCDNIENTYNHNFQGRYCWCDKPYSHSSASTMLQCNICQDWFHDICINKNQPDYPMPNMDLFEQFTCCDCVEKNKFLMNYVNGMIFGSVTKTNLKKEENPISTEREEIMLKAEKNILKRKEIDVKSITKIDDTITEIQEDPKQQKFITKKSRFNKDEPTRSGENSDNLQNPPITICKICTNINEERELISIFWKIGWETMLCRCTSCLSKYQSNGISFLIESEEEETSIYIPPKEDTESSTSILETCVNAFATTLPPVQQRELLLGFGVMSEKLKEFLDQFAASGRTVSKSDVKSFFLDLNSTWNS